MWKGFVFNSNWFGLKLYFRNESSNGYFWWVLDLGRKGFLAENFLEKENENFLEKEIEIFQQKGNLSKFC